MNKIEDNLEKNLEKINRPSRRNYKRENIVSSGRSIYFL